MILNENIENNIKTNTRKTSDYILFQNPIEMLTFKFK